MISCPAKRTIPPFRRRQRRTMDSEVLRFRIPDSLALNASDIRPVAQLRLTVASYSLMLANHVKQRDLGHTYDLPILNFGKPVLALLLVALFTNRSGKHSRL